MNVYDAIISRRSTRRFDSKAVPEEILDKLVEAGRYAPSGGNSQSTHFFVITDRGVLNELTVLVQQAFAEMEVTEGMYASLVSSITRSKQGGYVFHYNCPALIVTANQKDYGNNIADCACALENMMILGNEMDLGTCWINQLKWLNEDPRLLALFRKYGLEENERIYGALAVGYAADGKPERTPLVRKGNPVTHI
jgi:nitroreductase